MPDEDSFFAKMAANTNEPREDILPDRWPTVRFSAPHALQPPAESTYFAPPSHHNPGMCVAEDGIVSTMAHLGFLSLFFLYRLGRGDGRRCFLCRGLCLLFFLPLLGYVFLGGFVQ
jgi:hypothetical protein